MNIYPKELKAGAQKGLNRHVPSSIIPKKLETIWMSTDGWIDEQNVVGTYHGILFYLKKEWNSVICDNTEEAQ